jgi:predicted transglutaminase-like cysteine proteinase
MQNASTVPGQGGSNGVFQERACTACGDTSVWLGLARTGRHRGGETGGHSLRPFTNAPFGPALRALYTRPVYNGGLLRKWLGVAHKLEDERVQLALCDGDRERCVSEAALKFLRIVDRGRQRDGRARVAEINRAINLAIRPMEDLAQWGEVDVWSSPLVTFNTGAGDCEDYAIAKYVALQMAGISAEDLRIVVVLNLDLNGEGHAVASVRLDGHWLILDNQQMAMVEDVNAGTYRPRFVIDESGVMEYSNTPLLVSAPERNNKGPAVAIAAQPGSMTASK